MTISRISSSKRLNYHLCELPKASTSNLPKLPPNAKFYSRWKRNLQKLIIVSARHPLTRFFLRSHAAIAFEKRRHGRSLHWWTIHPCSSVRFCWDILMTFVLLYMFIAVPYVISFHRIAKSSDAKSWNIVHSTFLLCLIDIVLNFITGFTSSDGHEIFLDPFLIARNYVRGYFVIDMISSIPYTWFYNNRILPAGPNANSFFLIPEMLPLLKVSRICTLRRYIKQISTTCGISHAEDMKIWLVILTLLIFHWSGCLTHLFPHIIMHIGRQTIEESRIYQFEIELYKEPSWKIYLVSLHIGVSNLIGSSFIEFNSLGILDKVIRCVLLLLGKGYMIYLTVIILQLVESSADPELKYQQIMQQVKGYIHDKQLPKRLSDKLTAYYEYRFQGSYFKEDVISRTLSNHLNQEITIHSCRGLLEIATTLHNLPRPILGSLMGVLRPEIYLEGDVIYKCDAEGECMYFVASGTLALITYFGKEICHVQDGEHFGESALVSPNERRLESVIALEVCELLRLDRRDFKRLFALRSDFYDRLEKIAKQRAEKINSLNEGHQDFEDQPQNTSSLKKNTEKKNEVNEREDIRDSLVGHLL